MPVEGERVYKGAVTDSYVIVNFLGNELDLIDFSKAWVKNEDEVFYSLPLNDVKAISSHYIRVSVTCQILI